MEFSGKTATTVFVLPPDRGIEFINTLPNCESLVVTENGNQFKTASWKNVVS